MKSLLTPLIFLIFHLSIFGQKKQVCFTVDDLPTVSYGNDNPMNLWGITLNLISTFDKYQIPAIGFVNEGKMHDEGVLDSLQLDLLKMWFQNGYEIGNHTYSHKSYHQSTLSEFTKNIFRGEAISRHLEQEYNKELRYFRHPYLHIGTNQARYDSLNSLLDSLNYTVAPVTIVNIDWEFAAAYVKAESEQDKDRMVKIGQAYVDFTEDMMLLAERQSNALFGRNISQILLIHANKLNADYADELAEMLVENGYSFVTLDGALEDEAYQTKITEFKNGGSSWLENWARSQHKMEGFNDDAPAFPEWINGED